MVFDIFDLPDIPTFVLTNPNAEQLFSLGGIVNRKYCSRFNALSELSFRADEYIDGILMPYYDYLVHRRLVLLENVGYFMITSNEEFGDGVQKYKEIKCQSLEVDFASKKLSLFKGTYKFYDPITPSGTLLYTLLQYMPGWTVGTVDTSVAVKYRTFDESDTTIYNLMMTKIEQSYECVFIFDTLLKTVSAYDLTNATENTDIYISYDNVVQDIKVNESTDELVTALTVLGGGDLSISTVNPLGTDVIYDFSYFTSSGSWMSAGLISAITSWEAAITANQATYASTLSSLLTVNTSLLTAQGELNTLIGEYNALEQVKFVRMQHGLDISAVNAQLAAKQSEITNKTAEVTNYQTSASALNVTLEGINTLLSFDTNFTASQQEELNSYIIQSSYINENFIQTDTMTVTEIQAEAQELYDQSIDVLSRISEPRYTFEVNSVNFLMIKDFQNFIDQIVLGAVINLEIKPDVITYPVLLGFDLNYDDPTDFKLIFGNRLRLDDGAFQFSDFQGDSLSAATTSKVNSTLWTDRGNYTENTVKTFITSALDASVNNVTSGSSQNILINETGIRIREMTGVDTYSDTQMWLNNGVLVITDDNWDSARLVLGSISAGSGTVFGLAADVIAGRMVASNQLTITNDNNKFLLDGSGATLTDAIFSINTTNGNNKILLDPTNGIKIQKNNLGTWSDVFYADTAGNLRITGTLVGANGTFSGTVSAGTITGGTISGASITGGTISGTTGTFSGNVSAANLQGLLTSDQISSLVASKVSSGTMSNVNLSGGRGSITVGGAGQMVIDGSNGVLIQSSFRIDLNSSGYGVYYNGDLIATQNWVNSSISSYINSYVLPSLNSLINWYNTGWSGTVNVFSATYKYLVFNHGILTSYYA
jgi:hypothetical protein